MRQNALQKTACNSLYFCRSAAASSLPAERSGLSATPAAPPPCLPPGQRSRCRPARCAPCQSTPVRLPQSARALPAWFRWQDLYAAPFRCTLPAARAECLRQFPAVHGQGRLPPQAALFQNSGLPTKTRRFPAAHTLRCAAVPRLRQCRAASRSCAAPHPPAPAVRWSGCRSPLPIPALAARPVPVPKRQALPTAPYAAAADAAKNIAPSVFPPAAAPACAGQGLQAAGTAMLRNGHKSPRAGQRCRTSVSLARRHRSKAPRGCRSGR